MLMMVFHWHSPNSGFGNWVGSLTAWKCRQLTPWMKPTVCDSAKSGFVSLYTPGVSEVVLCHAVLS